MKKREGDEEIQGCGKQRDTHTAGFGAQEGNRFPSGRPFPL